MQRPPLHSALTQDHRNTAMPEISAKFQWGHPQWGRQTEFG